MIKFCVSSDKEHFHSLVGGGGGVLLPDMCDSFMGWFGVPRISRHNDLAVVGWLHWQTVVGAYTPPFPPRLADYPCNMKPHMCDGGIFLHLSTMKLT